MRRKLSVYLFVTLFVSLMVVPVSSQTTAKSTAAPQQTTPKVTVPPKQATTQQATTQQATTPTVFPKVATPTPTPQQTASASQATSTPLSTTPGTKPTKALSEAELASLMAPIALYPDKVITQILVASTYPLEVVQASRWVQANKTLKGDALVKEVKKQDWDQSVQELTALPDVLKMMDDKIDWTQRVGDAVLSQQKEVLATVQKLRQKAKESGNLKSDEKMTVKTEKNTESATPAQVIVIESSSPETIYVPTYSSSVYGPWGYPSYPPYYWPPPYGYPGSGFWWGMGMGIAIGIWGGAWGGYYAGWGGGSINVGISVGGGVGGVGGIGGVGGVGGPGAAGHVLGGRRDAHACPGRQTGDRHAQRRVEQRAGGRDSKAG